ncbi:MAG: hypothetical protein KC635_15325 [Myxococcales bacterium]|nr:hypothetical protein [Myxococcales bacterium]
MRASSSNPAQILALALTVALGLAVSACGDDGGGPSTDTAVDVSDGDAADVVDTADAADTADTADGDTVEPPDTADTSDVTDTSDTADTTDTADAADTVTTVTCTWDRPAGFDDHTVLSLESADCARKFGAGTSDPIEVKFVSTAFEDTASLPEVRFMESAFYSLHDEWYFFRLLNGAPIPGDWSVAPVTGYTLPTIASIYAAFPDPTPLPLGLARAGSRITAWFFYQNADVVGSSSLSRYFGIGTLLYYPPNPDRRVPGEIWAFDLEYGDQADPNTVARFFQMLEARLPADVASALKWLPRSPYQESIGNAIQAGTSPYKDRVMSFDDLVTAGEVVGYNPGITAGRVKVVRAADFSAASLASDQIVVLERVPDDIPPVAGIVSAVPQTALAHVNLLAKARGTPNAYVAGIFQWSQLHDWEYLSRRVILKVTADDAVWKPISVDQYNAWRALVTVPDRTITQVDDLASAPYVVDVTDGGLPERRALVPLIGGKCAGILAFQEVPGMTTPDTPVALSIRGYAEHFASLEPTVRAVLLQTDFKTDSRVRYLVLEGEEAFRAANTDAQTLSWLSGFLAAHAGDVLGQVIAQGGVAAMVRDKPIDPTYLATIRAALEQRFSALSPSQALRFRSSATAEDVVGFNGAGLYVSNTGFLYPEVQPKPKDRDRTIEKAIQETWSSYWGFPAFEERKIAGIDHLAGRMAVLVHPRFDDDKEDANGVITYYLSRWTDPPLRRLVVNVQDGSLSVTNPGGTLIEPEIDEVIEAPGGGFTVHRLQGSTIVPAGQWVLSVAELEQLAGQVGALADKWLDDENGAKTAAVRNKALVLDLEIKRMATGWPILASGEQRPGGLVYKQVRVLDQAPAVGDREDPWISAFNATEALPGDLRTVATGITARGCSSALFDLRVYGVATDPAQADLYPFSTTPFVYRAYIGFHRAESGWGWPTDFPYWLTHPSFTSASLAADGSVSLAFSSGLSTFLDVDSVTVRADGSYELRRGDRVLTGSDMACEDRAVYESPASYLEGLLAAP